MVSMSTNRGDYGIIDRYFDWLCYITGDRFGIDSYKKLLKSLFRREFIWILEMDSNRVADGEGLRYEFEDGFIEDARFLKVNVLEVLIGIARRMDFLCEKESQREDYTEKCFWEIVDNLGLLEFDDRTWSKTIEPEIKIDRILDIWMSRKFGTDGKGSLFPLNGKRDKRGNRIKDQRDVEIWYQMQTYMMEKECIECDDWGW